MTRLLFLDDAYQKTATGRVAAITDQGGIVLDACLFYPTSGGQPGDSGVLEWEGGTTPIATTIKDDQQLPVLIPAEAAALPPAGAKVVQLIDWERRNRHMRVHTALHLLSVVIPLPVTGGAIAEDKGRLDFDMEAPPNDKEALTETLNKLVDADHVVSDSWISDDELDANPGLVKTLTVEPPRGTGKVRLVRIGSESHQIDLQPCGGTHVARTSEIGRLRIGKIAKKGARNRRVYLHLES